MSNLTEKQLSIVEGLKRDFPDGEVTRKDLMDWAKRCGLSKYAPSFIWNNEHKIKLFRVGSELFPWHDHYELNQLPQIKEISKMYGKKTL